MIIGYHGTNVRFIRFDQSMSRIDNDFYGGGVAYFTSDMEVARNYAKNASRRHGGEGLIYKCELNPRKIFDVDDRFTGKPLLELIRGIDIRMFASGAKLLRLGQDPAPIIAAIRDGTAILTGDQVFRGLSNGMINTAMARSTLMRCGYDCLRYNGGDNMGQKKHDAHIMYSAHLINITNRYIVSTKPVSSEEQKIMYSYI